MKLINLSSTEISKVSYEKKEKKNLTNCLRRLSKREYIRCDALLSISQIVAGIVTFSSRHCIEVVSPGVAVESVQC